ncbi:MAG: DoxX family protein [Candidatus Omnitrophica bacterium]|nr:DoxX family protein [Candidatus Omnitrophota bacterium]
MNFILFLMRIVLGGVFVYSGWGKLMSPVENFKAVVESYQFFSALLVKPISYVVPWLELVFGAFVLVGYLTRQSTVLLALFLLSFIVLLSRSLLMHLPISECGCFGSGIVLAPWQALVLDSGLFLIAFILLKRKSNLFSLDRRLHR